MIKELHVNFQEAMHQWQIDDSWRINSVFRLVECSSLFHTMKLFFWAHNTYIETFCKKIIIFFYLTDVYDICLNIASCLKNLRTMVRVLKSKHFLRAKKAKTNNADPDLTASE